MYVEDIGRLYARKMVNYDLIKLKFSFSEKVIKMLRNSPYGFEIYLENVKTIRTIAQIFVAFSKKLNFNRTLCGIMSIFGGYSQLLIYSIWHRIGHHSRRTLYKVTSSKSFFISLKGSVKFVFIPTM
jgi:hypothetical protein